MNDALKKVKEGTTLTINEAEHCLRCMLDPLQDAGDIKNMLNALIEKGEEATELIGFAVTLRDHAVAVPHRQKQVLDVCGTGGSGHERFNISTTVALLCASLGLPVAKHGNVGSQKPNGSFDFLKALSIPIDYTPEESAKQLNDHNLCFLFARAYHPVLKRLAPIRKEIGKRSIFNLVGPLCNPANPTHQILGCTDIKTAHKMAKALQQLGREKAIVLVGEGGCDEVSLTGKTDVIMVTPNNIRQSCVHPSQIGVKVSPYQIGTMNENITLFHRVFQAGDETHPLAVHVALSSAFAIWMMGLGSDIAASYQIALTCIKDKRLYATFEKMVKK